MTIAKFKEILSCNEPDFSYNGQTYSICWPDGRYYVLSSDNPNDSTMSFDSLDDLLNNWIIQGKPLVSILDKIQMD